MFIADALDYNLDYGRNVNYFDGMNFARPSDHSPVVVGLDLTGNISLRRYEKRRQLLLRRGRKNKDN